MTNDKLKSLEVRAKEAKDECIKWHDRLDHFTALLHTDMDTVTTTHSLIKLMYATRTDISITHDALIKTVDTTSRGLVQRIRDVNETRMKLYAAMGTLNQIEKEISKLKELQNVAATRQPKIKVRNKK